MSLWDLSRVPLVFSVFLFLGNPGSGPGPRRHPYNKIQFIREGRGVWMVNGKAFEGAAGDIFVIRAGEIHSCKAVSDAPLVQLDIHLEFKEAAVRRLELGASVDEVARACEVNPNVLHRWKRELHDHGVKAFAGNGRPRAEEERVAALERKVGRQALEIDFLQRCLQHVEEDARSITRRALHGL